MNCAEFEAELQEQLDRRTFSSEKPVHDHLRTCAACRETWSRNRLLADAIAVWRAQTPDVDLVNAVVAAYVPDGARPGSAISAGREHALFQAGPTMPPARTKSKWGAASLRHSRWALAAVASGLAAVIAISTFVPLGEPPDKSGLELANSRTPVEALGPTAEERELALMNQAGAAYHSLATSAAGALEEFASIVIPVRPAAGPDDEDPATGERWIDGLPHRLRPIGQSLGDAFDFLWEVGEQPQNSRT